MKLYSYIVTHDSGFAPNPFWGYCTLATCKPAIRRKAQKGDLIVGLSPKDKEHRIVYVMRVDETLTFDQYFKDPRFKRKVPDYAEAPEIHRCGDNCYEPGTKGRYRQLPSKHSKPCGEHAENKAHDLGGVNVLVSKHFRYFGSKAMQLPKDLEDLKVGRSHKCQFPVAVIEEVECLLKSKPFGVQAAPAKWPDGDDSWRLGCGKALRHRTRT